VHRDMLDNVSRETMDLLIAFEALVSKWTRKINLVSANDIPRIWDRHIVDSVQIYDLAPYTRSWIDLGSGGGFPGIVAAIIAKEKSPDTAFTLIDSDQRKCAFLRTAIRELGLNAKACAERVEQISPQSAGVLTARALDDLAGLLHHAERHLAPDGVALFPKGANWQKEHEAAQNHWSYELDVIKSTTNPDATILKIKELSRA